MTLVTFRRSSANTGHLQIDHKSDPHSELMIKLIDSENDITAISTFQFDILPRMKFIKVIFIPGLIVMAAIGVSSVMIMNRPGASLKVPEAPTLMVNSFTVKAEDVTIMVVASGTVSPHTETLLVSEVAGRIISVSPVFHSGGFFQKDEVILKIDPRNHLAELKLAEANLVKAKTPEKTRAVQ